MTFYPKISADAEMALRLIVENSVKDGGYLTHRDCPYGEFLKGMVQKQLVFAGERGGVEDIDIGEIDVEEQIMGLLMELERMGKALRGLAPNEKLGFFKTKASLVEKLLSMQEATLNLKAMQEFRARVIEGLDTICSPDQITQFREILES